MSFFSRFNLWVMFLSLIAVLFLAILFFIPPADAPQADLGIEVLQPKQSGLLTSKVKILGRARGNWFFEATFPVTLYDENGPILAKGYAEAKTDWMTGNFVPFEVKLPAFEAKGQTGLLLFENANPSGEEANRLEFTWPVSFE